MKKALLGLALLTTLTTVTFAGEVKKEKKTKKTKVENCEKSCEKGSTHACCMKKAQA